MRPYKSIEWLEKQKAIRLIDQKILPAKVEYNNYSTVIAVAEAITDMTVRGAPVIGVAAAYGLVLAVFESKSDDLNQLAESFVKADKIIRAARPTAVNLFWALDQMAERVAKQAYTTADEYRKVVLACAKDIEAEDIAINKSLSTFALELLPEKKVTFMHHCNTGALATVDYGTALGVIRMAHESGRQVHVFVDETRPRLQGARLTSWELQQQGISHQLIVDGASSHVMQKFDVDMCVVGCDRVAANGDFANKVGTCNLATVAKANGVDFYVAAPLSTIDLETSCGGDIEIEERDSTEVTVIDGARVAPEGIEVYNPAFDVTQAELITAIITEKGIVYPPFLENLRKIKEL